MNLHIHYTNTLLNVIKNISYMIFFKKLGNHLLTLDKYEPGLFLLFINFAKVPFAASRTLTHVIPTVYADTMLIKAALKAL